MSSKTSRSALYIVIIGLSSYYFIYNSSGQSGLFAVLTFIVILIASLLLYQSFEQFFPNSSTGTLLFFFGRLAFIGAILFTNYLLISRLHRKLIQSEGISTYAIAGQITSKYKTGKFRFFRSYSYYANGKIIVKKILYNDNLMTGDTLYLRYSASQPDIIEFEQNEQNRKHRIID